MPVLEIHETFSLCFVIADYPCSDFNVDILLNCWF